MKEETHKEVIYSIIDSTTARAGSIKAMRPSAEQRNCSFSINVLSSVFINRIRYMVIEIGENAFYGVENIQSITIPNTVKILRYRSFGNMKSLRKLDIPNSVELIETNAFESTFLHEITYFGNKEPKMYNRDGTDIYLPRLMML